MPRQNLSMDLIPGKIRKRGCSSSASSSSSILQNYRFKRAVLVGKKGGSYTPLPTWKLISSRSRSPASAFRAMDSPKYASSQCGAGKSNQAPVSARKLAATLWEMNEMPSPKLKEGLDLNERRLKKELRAREKMARSVVSGSLPPHLSDPSHSPVSERMDRSGTGNRQRGTPSISQMLKLRDHNAGVHDSLSNASLMEVETRSRAQTPASNFGVKTRLKDVSNALTTSKELLKIINRLWGHEDRPSSSMSLISALHAELERARLQVNQLIQDQRSEQNDINYLMKCFAEEKAAWKSKEKEVIEAAIDSVAGELEVERKLRRRSESFNKKLGRELAETKTSLLKVVKQLESEKRAREIMEQMCDELARDIGDDKVVVDEFRREKTTEVSEEVKKEREIMLLADIIRNERAQIDISEENYQVDENSVAVDRLRNQLEAFLGNKRSCHSNEEEIASYQSRNRFSKHQNEESGDGEVENGAESGDSAESDLHSVELNMDNNSKSYNWIHASGVGRDSRRPSIEDEIKGRRPSIEDEIKGRRPSIEDEIKGRRPSIEDEIKGRRPSIEDEIKGRKSLSGKAPKKSTSLQRSISDGIEWGSQAEIRQPITGDVLDWERISSLEKHGLPGRANRDDLHGLKSTKTLRDHVLSASRLGSNRVNASPTRQSGQPWPQEKVAMVPGGFKTRLMEVQNARKANR